MNLLKSFFFAALCLAATSAFAIKLVIGDNDYVLNNGNVLHVGSGMSSGVAGEKTYRLDVITGGGAPKPVRFQHYDPTSKSLSVDIHDSTISCSQIDFDVADDSLTCNTGSPTGTDRQTYVLKGLTFILVSWKSVGADGNTTKIYESQ